MQSIEVTDGRYNNTSLPPLAGVLFIPSIFSKEREGVKVVGGTAVIDHVHIYRCMVLLLNAINEIKM